METMLGEWIVRQYAALLCKYDYGLKKLQCLGCTIGLKTDHCAQVNIKVMNDYMGQFRRHYILATIFQFQEILKVFSSRRIFVICGQRFSFTNLSLDVLKVLDVEIEESCTFLVLAKINALYFIKGKILVKLVL